MGVEAAHPEEAAGHRGKHSERLRTRLWKSSVRNSPLKLSGSRWRSVTTRHSLRGSKKEMIAIVMTTSLWSHTSPGVPQLPSATGMKPPKSR